MSGRGHAWDWLNSLLSLGLNHQTHKLSEPGLRWFPRAHPNYDAETVEQSWVAPQSSLYEMDVNCGFCRALWKMNERGLDSVNSGLAASEQVGSPPPPRSLRNLLDGEMEHSAALRQEVDTLKRKVAEPEERHVTKVQALAR